jgi:iron complex transport system substrate-binding protein
VTARIEQEAAAHPEFAGRTAAVVTPYEGLFIYGPEDPRGRMLAQLGFELPEVLLRDQSKDFGWSVSAERTSDLADLECGGLARLRRYGRWDAGSFRGHEGLHRGSLLDITDGAYYVGHSMVIPLSIPYVLDRYVPRLAAAVDGDPATKPPAATD